MAYKDPIDRVMETTTTTGTGTLSLGGAVAGYQAVGSAYSNGDSSTFCVQAVDATGTPTGDWEVFDGTYSSGGNTLSRDTVLASSNAGAAVTLAAGTKRVFACLPRERASITKYGAFSTRPTAGVPGRLFIPNDGYGVQFVDNGTTWDVFAQGFGPFDPSLSDFTTSVNFSTRGSISTSNGFAQLVDAGPATNADFIMARVKAAPATPWTMTVAFRPHFVGNGAMIAGIILRDSGTSKLKVWCYSLADVRSFVYNFTNETTISSTPFSTSTGKPVRMAQPSFLRVTNDGTNLKFYESVNFKDWYLQYSEAVAANFVATINQVGFFFDPISAPNSNTEQSRVDFFHAKTT